MNKFTVITCNDNLLFQKALAKHLADHPKTQPFCWPEVRRYDNQYDPYSRLPLPQNEVVQATYNLINRLIKFPEINIITATHSDIVLSTIRLAVYREHISHEQVEILWCDKQFETEGPQTITVNKDGRIHTWPEGFFTQYVHLLEGLCFPKYK